MRSISSSNRRTRSVPHFRRSIRLGSTRRRLRHRRTFTDLVVNSHCHTDSQQPQQRQQQQQPSLGRSRRRSRYVDDTRTRNSEWNKTSALDDVPTNTRRLTAAGHTAAAARRNNRRPNASASPKQAGDSTHRSLHVTKDGRSNSRSRRTLTVDDPRWSNSSLPPTSPELHHRQETRRIEVPTSRRTDNHSRRS